MIIVEGPDGAGKSTLVKKIVDRYNIPVHPRFVDSDGPKDHTAVYEAVVEDMKALHTIPICIYDRHPLISEYVYGPIVRRELHHEWQTPVSRLMRSMLAENCLVVWCLPDVQRVRENVDCNRDMPGVESHIDQIYASYLTIKSFWPGKAVRHNYQDPYNNFVLDRIGLHIETETQKRRLIEENLGGKEMV